MPERKDEMSPAPDSGLSEKIGAREQRKLRARVTRDRTLWLGLGMFGVIGWSIVVPTVMGIILGLWLDRRWPGPFSWTLALLLAGVTLGCFNAWYWISNERRMIDAQEGNAEQ